MNKVYQVLVETDYNGTFFLETELFDTLEKATKFFNEQVTNNKVAGQESYATENYFRTKFDEGYTMVELNEKEIM